MEQPTEAQIKEFWEKLGYSVRVIEHAYHTSFDLEVDYHIPIPLKETIDLNNLFKYAVPKLYGWKLETLKPKIGSKKMIYATVMLTENTLAKVAWNKDPALALFWAIWQVRES